VVSAAGTPQTESLHQIAALPQSWPAAHAGRARILRVQREAIMSKSAAAAYFNVFTVREFEGSTGQKAKSWTKVGVAFPHREGPGFNLELSALPLDGRLVALVPSDDEEGRAASG
jgi:hypothetical protein